MNGTIKSIMIVRAECKGISCCLCFLIDEGVRIRWHKLWDNLYGLEAITSVEIVRSRKIAADTAVINISNIYRGLLTGLNLKW